MDLIVKQASTLTEQEKTDLGITGIPDAWPIESYPYTGTVPTGFTQMSEEDLQQLKNNNQAAYDAWLQGLRPVITNDPIQAVEVQSGKIASVQELITSWSVLKSFFTATKGAFLNYIDLGNEYYIWLCFRNQKVYIPNLVKGSTDAIDFEANYKVKCNVEEYPRVRITINKAGRRMHARFISITTASLNSDPFDNTDWKSDSFNDVTYTMKKYSNGSWVTTTNESECTMTWVDFEPHYDFEWKSGWIDVPSTLPVDLLGDEDEYEVHAIVAPDIPEANGGCVNIVANPHLKWAKGKQIALDSALNPAEFLYNATLHTNKIRYIFRHPAGKKCDFQIQMTLYKH